MKYQFLPEKPLPKEYKTYQYSVGTNATDAVPLSTTYVEFSKPVISGYKNVTPNKSKDGFITGGKIITLDRNNKEVSSDVTVNVLFGNIELTSKDDKSNKTAGTQPGTEVMSHYSTLGFNFSYTIQVVDNIKGVVLLDTVVNTPRKMDYPQDYSYDKLKGKVPAPTYTSKPALDLSYRRFEPNLYQNTKEILVIECMNEVAAIATHLFGYKNGTFEFAVVSKVKSKNPVFLTIEKASDDIEIIIDSVKTNYKADKNLNWHTKEIYEMADKCVKVWESCITDSNILNEFKDSKDRQEFINLIKRNLIVGYLFTNRFDEAKKLVVEIKPFFNKSVFGQVLEDGYITKASYLVDREARTYKVHKEFFNFQ
ncbi:MAG: hypothetical protein V4667_11455 [Bacteroidota bacterium]